MFQLSRFYFQSDDLESAQDKTFIASAQSPMQKDLLAAMQREQAVTVEGAFITYLRYKSLVYFILKGEQTEKTKVFQNVSGKMKDQEGMFPSAYWVLFKSN
jgi:signaling intermediate in Toll pathway protein